MKSSTEINHSLKKRLTKERRSKLGKIDILEIPKEPLHSNPLQVSDSSNTPRQLNLPKI
jgi:hypothetical protein